MIDELVIASHEPDRGRCPRELIDAEFGAASSAFHLIETAMRPRQYDAGAAETLLAAARGSCGEVWAERSLAVLLLENYLLRLAPAAAREAEALVITLGVREGLGILPRLARLNRAHRAILTPDCEAGWRYFFRVSRDATKLTLARYVFAPVEVVAEIRRHLAISSGATSLSGSVPGTFEAPEYEAAVLAGLCAGREIYWVSERCSSELNGLVEFPLTSAVVVVKPPGSDWEMEFKRAGTRGPKLLDVITEREGREAPVSHRLFGGSLGWLGEREASSAALFSRIYELVHGCPAPCSQTVVNTSIVTVPTAAGESHILDYLTGEGVELREAMRDCVENFPRDTGVAPASYEGDRGLTLQFVGQALPQQAVILGSSSFRLDRIALYLSNEGAEQYFRAGLGRDYSPVEARWLADSVLEEILGEIVLPEQTPLGYGAYVDELYAVPANRRCADFRYRSVMRQAGECWGTLLAIRGFSDGESFVQRNVGLKSIWRDGEWQVRIIFMDHDDLTMAGSRYAYLWPARELAGMERDQIHILGGSFGDDPIPGMVGALRAIYRVSSEVAASGVQTLESATAAAYRHTQAQLDGNAGLRALFYSQFLDRHRDFDRLIGSFLTAGVSDEVEWKHNSETFLRGGGYERELIAESVEAILRYRAFLNRMRFLYDTESEHR